MSLSFDVIGAGIATTGVPDWEAFLAVLAGANLVEDRQTPPSALLSPRERRRAPRAAKLSFAAAEQACAMAGLAPSEPIAVFSSGMGDLDITDYMCKTLKDSPELLSPTRFHNSVHNAASGYWSIGAGATGDVTAISGWRDSAAAGLLEALSRLGDSDQPVLLVVYDDLAQGPMRSLWPTEHAFSGALVLTRPGAAGAQARLLAEITRADSDAHDPLPATLAERMADNPAARLLPMLGLIAGHGQSITLGSEQGPGISIKRQPA